MQPDEQGGRSGVGDVGRGQSGLKVGEKSRGCCGAVWPRRGWIVCVCVCLVLGCHYMVITYNETTNGLRLGGVDRWVGWCGWLSWVGLMAWASVWTGKHLRNENQPPLARVWPVRPPPPATPFHTDTHTHTHTDTQRLANYAAHRGRHVPRLTSCSLPHLAALSGSFGENQPGHVLCFITNVNILAICKRRGWLVVYICISECVCVCVCDQSQRESGRTCRLCVYQASHACEAYVHTCVRVCVSAWGWSRPLNHPHPCQSMPHAAHEEGSLLHWWEEPKKIDQCVRLVWVRVRVFTKFYGTSCWFL